VFSFFGGGRAGSPSNNVASAEAYLHTKWHLDPCSRLAGHNRYGPKIGGSASFFGKGNWVLPSNTISLGPKPISLPSGILIHAAIWPQQIWAENGALCPFAGGGVGSTSTRMWPGPRPTRTPSFILIRRTVWTLATIHQRHRQTGQTTVG